MSLVLAMQSPKEPMRQTIIIYHYLPLSWLEVLLGFAGPHVSPCSRMVGAWGSCKSRTGKQQAHMARLRWYCSIHVGICSGFLAFQPTILYHVIHRGVWKHLPPLCLRLQIKQYTHICRSDTSPHPKVRDLMSDWGLFLFSWEVFWVLHILLH